ncbi:MAG: hypothetical protein WBN63_10080 [Eudoraea sp.]|uniref:hypothetical protein n=1 Tax=Eudoraea sp. TaxID=1979955 RepID=UPI003C70B58C
MDVTAGQNNYKKIKYSLVFFYVLLFLSCTQEDGVKNVSLQYSGDKAISVSFETGNAQDLKIFVRGEAKTSVLGEIKSLGNKHSFTPIVPFRAGHAYEIRKGEKNLALFKVKNQSNLDPPQLVNIFPSKDTVPENLLKLYFVFSSPMQEVGNALDFISVYNETEQREDELFLKLEKDLWNNDHTRLTLWLDPGRIKTGLIPNKLKGLPLKQGNSYTITVSDKWKSARGIKLPKNYTKRIVVGKRDDNMPNIHTWELSNPMANTTEALRINFGESMDAVLARESLRILFQGEFYVGGNYRLDKQEEIILFTPVNTWKKGTYDIISESKIEDLSGNNMNHLFDTNTADLKDSFLSETHYKRSFIVQ